MAVTLPVAAQPPVIDPPLQIAGAVEHPGAWTAAQMATQFAADIKPISYTLKGVKHTTQCAILLTKLLDAAKLKANPHIKHAELQFTIAVSGRGWQHDWRWEIGELPRHFPGHE